MDISFLCLVINITNPEKHYKKNTLAETYTDISHLHIHMCRHRLIQSTVTQTQGKYKYKLKKRVGAGYLFDVTFLLCLIGARTPICLKDKAHHQKGVNQKISFHRNKLLVRKVSYLFYFILFSTLLPMHMNT